MVIIKTKILDPVNALALQYVKDAVGNIQIGDDNTTPTEGDSAIGNLINTLPIESLDESTPNKLIYTASVGITQNNGETVKEITLSNTAGTEIYTHHLTIPEVKGSDEILWFQVEVETTTINK